MMEYLTNDVSFRGVFIRTDAPLALRQLVKFELVLPEKVIVSGHAMVVHVAERPEDEEKGTGPVPGMGIQFWGPVEHGREWELYIHDLKQRQRAGYAAAKAADKVRRHSERFRLSIEVEFDGERLMTRDISESGVAVRTDLAMPIGAHTDLRLRAGDKELVFDAIVRRAIDEPGFRGLGVELVGVTAEQRSELVRFLRENTPSEERILVPEGDPKLH